MESHTPSPKSTNPKVDFISLIQTSKSSPMGQVPGEEPEGLLVQEMIASKKVKEKLFRKQLNTKQDVALNTISQELDLRNSWKSRGQQTPTLQS